MKQKNKKIKTLTQPNNKKQKKLKVGIFSFTSCAGCQFEILDLEDELLDIFSKVDIIHFPMAKAKNEDGPFDVVFVEGAVTTPEEVKKIIANLKAGRNALSGISSPETRNEPPIDENNDEE